MLRFWCCVFVFGTALACSQTQNYCIDDATGHFSTETGVSVDACCDRCTGNSKCQMWNHWMDSSNKSQCYLFDNNKGNKVDNHGSCTVGWPGGRADRPNFIFYFPDTLRAESFSAYGNALDVTPNIDAFAKTGTRFEQAHVMHTQCSPSRCTMMTGRYMHTLGHRTQTHLIQDYEHNYFRTLKEAGYHIQWHGKNDALSATSFNLSVSNWSQTIGYQSGDNAFKYGEPGYFSFLNTGSNISGADSDKNADYKAVVEAVDWLQASPPEPFVMFLPTRGAHPPYGAPKEWHNKFPVEQVKQHITLRPPNLPNKPVYMGYDNGIPHWRQLTTLDDDVFYKIQSVYLGMIAYTDWIFGQLMKGLDNTNLNNRTAVFVSSDHGDFGGDFHLVEKWPGSMDDVLTRVPAIGRIPGGAQGHVVKSPIQTADIMETMLDLANVTSDEVRFGQSLRHMMMGNEGDMSRFVYSEGGFYFENEQMIEANECLSQCPKGAYCPRGQEEAQPNGSPRAVMMRNITAKLVYRPTGVSELYDLVADPLELHNVYKNASYARLKDELVGKLLDWTVLTADITPTYTDGRGLPKYPHPIGPDPWDGSLGKKQYNPMHYLEINGVNHPY